MTNHIHLYGILAAMLIAPFAGVAAAQDSPAGEDPKSAKALAALIAATPPQERDTKTPKNNTTGQARDSADLPKQGAKLTREMLEGIWLGERDGLNYEIRFLWFTEHQQARWRVWKEGRNFGLDTSVVLDARAGVAGFVFRKGFEFEHEYGKLTTGEGGAMLLDVTPNPHQRADYCTITSPQKGIVLTRQPGEARIGPKHNDARAIYDIWQRHGRLSGDIPGALIGELAAAVKQFIQYNQTWATVPKLNAILPRLDATRDWKPADAIALLDEVAVVQDSPLQTAAEKTAAGTIRNGEPLPEKYAGVTWGAAQPSGLRAAWVLEPGGAEHRIGEALKARLLVRNAGSLPVMTRVPTFHQGSASARDSGGAEIEVSGISWTTMARLVPVRLAPGEFIEINTPGVGLGPRAGAEPWAGPRVGSNVLAKPGTELALTHGSLPLDGSGVGRSEDAPHLIGAGWWLAHIKARLARELPLPASAAERTHLLERAVRELFTVAPTAKEIAAFTADQTPGALDALAKRLAERPDVVEFAGSLPTSPVKFRVLPADPAANKTPRVVLGPGEYPLGNGATLKMVGRTDGERYIYDTKILFEATEATGKLPPESHKLEVPGDWGTWAIVCRPGEGFFYLLHKGGAQKIDYSAPRKVTDTPATDLPAEFRAEVKRQLAIAGVSAESQAKVFEKPALPAAPPEPKSAEAGPRSD